MSSILTCCAARVFCRASALLSHIWFFKVHLLSPWAYSGLIKVFAEFSKKCSKYTQSTFSSRKPSDNDSFYLLVCLLNFLGVFFSFHVRVVRKASWSFLTCSLSLIARLCRVGVVKGQAVEGGDLHFCSFLAFFLIFFFCLTSWNNMGF